MPTKPALAPKPGTQTASQPTGQSSTYISRDDIGHGGAGVSREQARTTRDDSRITCGSSDVACDNTGILSDKRRSARIRSRGEAVLIGHRLLQTADRVASAKIQEGQRADRSRNLCGRHIDQPGIGHGLPRRRHE